MRMMIPGVPIFSSLSALPRRRIAATAGAVMELTSESRNPERADGVRRGGGQRLATGRATGAQCGYAIAPSRRGEPSCASRLERACHKWECLKRYHPAEKGHRDAAARVRLSRLRVRTAACDQLSLRNLLGARKHSKQLLEEDDQ